MTTPNTTELQTLSAASLRDFAELLRRGIGARRVVLCTLVGEVRAWTASGDAPSTAAEREPLERVIATQRGDAAPGLETVPLWCPRPTPVPEFIGAVAAWFDDARAEPRLAASLELRLLTQYVSQQRLLGMTRRQLERADRLAMVGRLAAGIAHELGTPLAVVAGRARQLASGTVRPEEAPAAAKSIAEQADRMAGIIRQLLDYARRRGPRPGRFDIRTLLRQAVALLEPVAERKQVKLLLADLPDARVVQFDGSQMMQVMTNLVANAIQATSAGGMVTVSLEEAELSPPEESGLPTRCYVGVRVSDTGAGIKPEHLAQVFDPFFTTKDTGEGTGLGLSVAQGIVRDHDGWIAVESQLGQGSSFIVHLPG
ncbi:MAG: sensor histidine kinase [Myxococcota bacterium]